MSHRWTILALLFCCRVVMAFQFQAIPALTAELRVLFAVGLDAIGFAFGLYMLPGIGVALPGALLAQRIDARMVVTIGLGLMTAGAGLMALAESWGVLMAGQAVAGVGGVLLNVLMTRMVADWFAGKEIATALAVFVNSYPVGIAVAFILLPMIGAGAGLWLSVGMAGAATVAFATLYKAPPDLPAVSAVIDWGDAKDRAVGLASGGVWGLFNAGIIVVVGLGPAFLMERGMSPEAAGFTTSAILIATSITGPFGGFVVDRFGYRDAIITGGLLAASAIILWAAFGSAGALPFWMLGAMTGLVAGPIMSLPAATLSPRARTTGMGLFFTVYYLAIVTAPWVGGWAAERAGTATAAFVLGASLQLAAIASLLTFRRVTLRE